MPTSAVESSRICLACLHQISCFQWVVSQLKRGLAWQPCGELLGHSVRRKRGESVNFILCTIYHFLLVKKCSCLGHSFSCVLTESLWIPAPASSSLLTSWTRPLSAAYRSCSARLVLERPEDTNPSGLLIIRSISKGFAISVACEKAFWRSFKFCDKSCLRVGDSFAFILELMRWKSTKLCSVTSSMFCLKLRRTLNYEKHTNRCQNTVAIYCITYNTRSVYQRALGHVIAMALGRQHLHSFTCSDVCISLISYIIQNE